MMLYLASRLSLTLNVPPPRILTVKLLRRELVWDNEGASFEASAWKSNKDHKVTVATFPRASFDFGTIPFWYKVGFCVCLAVVAVGYVVNQNMGPMLTGKSQ